MPPGLDNRLDWWWWEAKGSLHNIGKGLRQGLNFVYLLTVLGFESDGAAHSPGGLDLRLPLDLRQFDIGLLGQVLKEGVLHLRGLHCSATWSGCLLLSRRKDGGLLYNTNRDSCRWRPTIFTEIVADGGLQYLQR